MRRQLSLLEFGHPDFWRHVEVFYGAAQSAAELLGILGHRQRLGTGQVVDLADMWFRVGQHNSGRSPDVGAGDRRVRGRADAAGGAGDEDSFLGHNLLLILLFWFQSQGAERAGAWSLGWLGSLC